MKRTLIAPLVLIMALFTLLPVSGANHLSVPVDHRVYRILDAGRIRGLYDENLVAVKPYAVSTTVAILHKMADQPQLLRAGELEEILAILAEFNTTYGSESSGLDQLLSTGYLRFSDPDRRLGASFGVTVDSVQTMDLLQPSAYDSRNSVKAFLRGDIGSNISFNMDFGLTLDNLNPHPFLANEFTIPGEGFYLDLFHGGHPPSNIPFGGYYFGLTFNPELSASFFDGDVRLRWASIRRDWGPGLNNLLISSTARGFDGIELFLNPTPWFRYAVIQGSLGKFSTSSYKGEHYLFPSDYFGGSKEAKINYRFNNNYSAHRVELDITRNFTFVIYESVVWQKRFELGYLNPFSIFMFVQNNTGDIDSMFDGLDFSYTLSNKIRFYGGMALNEMNKVGNPIAMLKAPRNMFAFQLGAVIPLPIGTFSSLTAQWTYINPFVYTHYPLWKYTGSVDGTDNAKATTQTGKVVTFNDNKITITEGDFDPAATIDVSPSEKEWYDKTGRTKIKKVGGVYHIYETYAETMYVNKGELLGYPLQPNSQEFLLSLDMGLPKGWNAQAEIKYQVRSGQYGFDIWQFMYYGQTDLYPEKDFWNNTFQHTVSLLLATSKSLETMPITLSASYQFIIDWARPYELTSFDGRGKTFKDWSGPSVSHILQIGVKVYY